MTPASSWNFLRDNAALRSVISYKIEKENHKLSELAPKIGVNHDHLIGYYLKGRKPSLTNFQIVKLADVLGIEVSLKMELRTPTALGTP